MINTVKRSENFFDWVSESPDPFFEFRLDPTPPTKQFRAMGHVTGFGLEHYDQSDIGRFESALLMSDLRRAATVHRVTVEGDYPVPEIDDTVRGEILPESSVTPEQDLGTGRVTLGTYQLVSKSVAVHVSLLSSASDFPAIVESALGRRISRGQEFYALQGTGASQPNGLTNTAPASGVTLTAGAFGFDELVAVEMSVNHSYRMAGSWIMSHASAQLAKTVLDTQGRPCYQPGHRLLGITPTLLGYPVIESAYCLDSDVFFGDLSYIQYRESAQMLVSRSTESRGEFNQILFRGATTFDSALSISSSSQPPVTKTIVS